MSTQNDGVPRYIPTKIDDPMTILFMEPLQFSLVVSSIGIGMALDLMLLGLVMAFSFLFLLKKLKQGAKRGAGQHAMWATGFNLDKALSKYFPESVDNELIK